jgi:hypothetical protein
VIKLVSLPVNACWDQSMIRAEMSCDKEPKKPLVIADCKSRFPKSLRRTVLGGHRPFNLRITGQRLATASISSSKISPYVSSCSFSTPNGLADESQYRKNLFWVVLRRLWSRWKDPLILVTLRTVVGWNRAGFRLYWKWLSRSQSKGGRKLVSRTIRALIFQMVAENPTWGAPRIYGELLKLGFDGGPAICNRSPRTTSPPH